MTRALRNDQQLFAGDPFSVTGTVLGGLSGALLTCTVKRRRDDLDAAAIARASSASVSAIAVISATDFSVTFDASITRGWPTGSLWYDVQAESLGGELYTVVHGMLRVRRRMTLAHLEPGERPPLVADAGSLVLTAADASITIQRVLQAETAVLSLAAADAALTREVHLPELIASLGARLHFLFEVGVSTETLNGSAFSQLNDLGPGAYHLAQGTPIAQPVRRTTSGPNGKPWIEMTALNHRLLNSAIALSAGRALSFFAISKVTLSGLGGRVAACVRDKNTESLDATSDAVFHTANDSSGAYTVTAKVQSGAEEQSAATAPTNDAGWHSWWHEYAAGVAPVVEIDDVAVTLASPFSGTGPCTAVELISIGHDTLASGGVYLFGAVEDCTAADKAMIRSYERYQAGV
jgi:hypothetical protein